MESESKSCLPNLLLLLVLVGLALVVYWLFGDYLTGVQVSGGGSPLQGFIDSLKGFGNGLADMFKGFSR